MALTCDQRGAMMRATCGCHTNPPHDNCDKFTGYFSKEFGFENGDGITLKAVTCRQLYSYSNPCLRDPAFAQNFCNNLRYANGEIVPASELPAICGGTGPAFTEYNAQENALEDVMPQLEKLQKDFEATDRSKKYVALGILIFIVIILLAIIYAV
jgi:hypothetical protein